MADPMSVSPTPRKSFSQLLIATANEDGSSPNPILDSIKAAIIITDQTGIINYWNAAAEELYGWRGIEVLGRNILDITVSPETNPAAHECLATVNAGKSWSGEFDVRCKDGAFLAALITLSPRFDQDGALRGIIGVSQPLRSHGQRDGIVARGEGQFYALANALPELCWMADGTGSILWYNEKWYEFTGTTWEQMKGWGWQSVHDPQLLPSVLERWKRSLETGADFEMEFPLRAADGSYQWFLTRIRAVRDDLGNITRWFGSNANIHAQRELLRTLTESHDSLESRILERTAELHQANKGLRELSALLLQMRDQEARRLARDLHDSVGQLLAATKMNIATVKSESEKLSPNAARAVRDNERMVDQILAEIRTISHLLHPPLLDEAGIRSALGWFVEEFSQRSGIEVSLDIAESFDRLGPERETAIFRVVQECLSNIHRHSGSKTAAIDVWRENERVVVTVRDSGVGIPAEKLELNALGRSGVGFRGMAERLRYLGGSLEIQSDGKGTRVIAQLPFIATESSGEAVA